VEYETCAICGRSILRGERSTEYVDEDGERAGVCPLCKGRAEEMGWVPASFAAATRQAEPRLRRTAALRDRIVRSARTVGLAAPEPAEPAEPQAPPTPLEVFNASSEVRKVAGLQRSLGEPRVCVRPNPDGGGELVIVAWDLSWYRWMIRGTSVKQMAKGNEISELPVEDRDWNATAATDGSLSLG
jgi:hypothetical protein